ncbi:MAG: M12 family metallopeptidase, partial [Kangiellaceae bacterium]|nr:M12 family metallopeptidase [Kangiellaceae bacterium]
MNKLKRIKSAAVLLSLVSSSLLTSQSIFASSINLNSSLNNISQELTQEKIKISGREYYRYGDMLVPVEKHSIHSQFDLNKNKWTDGNVIYQFAPDVTQENRQQFTKATELWSQVAQLNFIERTDQTNYIYVENGDGNFATVGMAGGKQTLTMKNWGSLYVVVHELGHSLGMWHEQQRSDRDNYVEILTENILDDQRHNFNLHRT